MISDCNNRLQEYMSLHLLEGLPLPIFWGRFPKGTSPRLRAISNKLAANNTQWTSTLLYQKYYPKACKFSQRYTTTFPSNLVAISEELLENQENIQGSNYTQLNRRVESYSSLYDSAAGWSASSVGLGLYTMKINLMVCLTDQHIHLAVQQLHSSLNTTNCNKTKQWARRQWHSHYSVWNMQYDQS